MTYFKLVFPTIALALATLTACVSSPPHPPVDISDPGAPHAAMRVPTAPELTAPIKVRFKNDSVAYYDADYVDSLCTASAFDRAAHLKELRSSGGAVRFFKNDTAQAQDFVPQAVATEIVGSNGLVGYACVSDVEKKQ